jgi:uncharacterized protein (TIGR02271 family)
MRWTRNEVRAGMTVTSTKGERLGNVVRVGPDTFVVEKGVFFPKDYELRYDHIISLDGEQIGYSLSDTDSRFGNAAEEPRPVATARAAAPAAAPPTGTGAGLSASAASMPPTRKTAPPSVGTTRKGDVRIPLMEEEIGIEKISREAGHVRIHKIVKTEEKHFRVPITREDVVIERVSASAEDAGLSPELAFKEQTLDLPLHEEDVQITKRARVREQIVIHPVIQAAEKEAFASLRHEEAEIEDTRGRAVRSSSDGGATRPGYGAPGSNSR